jgi:hypothetical protein
MTENSSRVSYSMLITAVLSFCFTLGSFTANAQNAPGATPSGMPGSAPSGMPGGAGGPGGAMGVGPGGPGGGAPGAPMSWAPSKAAIYIENGAVVASKEYAPDQYKANIKSSTNGITITGIDLTSGDYAFSGIVAAGAKSTVTLDKVKMKLGVTKEAVSKDDAGLAIAASDGATMYVKDSDLTVDGAQRYVTNNSGESKMIVNDSIVTQTGSNSFTAKLAEPFSNDALLIYGIARANMSVGNSKTYYFNSKVTTEGWASLSTDACSSVDLYAYNTKAVAQHGGYGTYADFNCRVWIYGSSLTSPEIGAIIAKSGKLVISDGASTPADVLQYNQGKTTKAGSIVTGGRNAVMIHAPDMTGQGKDAADNGFLDVINSTLATDRNLKGTRNYATHLSKATDAYINYISGADLLIKSTSATVNFVNAKFDSFSGVAVMTVLNSDGMGNFLKNESDGKEVKPIAISMKDMNVAGDIKHMDYQRLMTLSLEKSTLKGAIVSGTVEDWNSLWTAFDKKDCKWLQNDKWGTFYGVQVTVKNGSTWIVSGPSLLSSLTVENGGAVKGKMQIDGKVVTPATGQTYTGKIVVTPL